MLSKSTIFAILNGCICVISACTPSTKTTQATSPATTKTAAPTVVASAACDCVQPYIKAVGNHADESALAKTLNEMSQCLKKVETQNAGMNDAQIAAIKAAMEKDCPDVLKILQAM
jgi:hypothetical protein